MVALDWGRAETVSVTGCRFLAVAAVTVQLLACAASARAATVGLRTVQDGSLEAVLLSYDAAPGEGNQVNVTLRTDPGSPPFVPSGMSVTVRDAGAPLVAGLGCSAVDAHAAQCFTASQSMALALGDLGDELVVAREGASVPLLAATDVRVHGGDGADRLTLGSESARVTGGAGDDMVIGAGFPPYVGREWLDGGPGNDRVFGGRGADQLDGGRGRDEVYGQQDDDVLLDGDDEDDLLSGGSGLDTGSYGVQTRSVRADLGERVARIGPGAPGRLRGIEHLVGGSGDDRLWGDQGDNELDGGPGRDTLSGRGGNDQLLNSEGVAACGPGVFDAVRGTLSAADVLGRDCELVAVGYEEDELTGELLPAHPRPATARTLTFTVTCAFTEEGRARCGDGHLLVREARGRHRRIAAGPLPSGHWEDRRVRARLTRTGRRLASRPGGVLATVRIGDYRPLGTMRWTIRLRLAGTGEP